MTEKKVFVTGGAGFIGSTLIRQLTQQGYQVTVFDNLCSGMRDNLPKDGSVRLVTGDVRDLEMVTSVMKGHKYVVHLGAQAFIPVSYQLPVNIAEINAVGSLNVFKACLDTAVERIIHISSSEVYGSAVYTPIDERHPTNPVSTYAVGKLAADLWAQTMHCEHKLPVVVLRPFNTFGPRDTLPRFIPEMIRQCLKEPVIRTGDVSTFRDYTYVEDTCKAIASALEVEGIEGELINFGTGKALMMKTILEMIMRETGAENKEVIEDTSRFRPKDVGTLIAGNLKAYKLLGWKPEVEFRDGLLKTISWYKGNGEGWSYEKYGWQWRY